MSDERGGRERRRAPRRAVRLPEPLELEIYTAVRLLDISHGGAMVAGLVLAPPGASASLRTALDGVPVALPLEIAWRGDADGAGSATRAGGEFTTLDSDARQRLEVFLSRVT